MGSALRCDDPPREAAVDIKSKLGLAIQTLLTSKADDNYYAQDVFLSRILAIRLSQNPSFLHHINTCDQAAKARNSNEWLRDYVQEFSKSGLLSRFGRPGRCARAQFRRNQNPVSINIFAIGQRDYGLRSALPYLLLAIPNGGQCGRSNFSF